MLSMFFILLKSQKYHKTTQINVYLCNYFSSRAALGVLLDKQKLEMISIIRLSLDLTHAVSTLPSGWFWGGKLKTWHVGALGTLSAMIGIYQYFAKKKLKTN